MTRSRIWYGWRDCFVAARAWWVLMTLPDKYNDHTNIEMGRLIIYTKMTSR